MPVSRILYSAFRQDIYHLSAMTIAGHLLRSTPQFRADSAQALIYVNFQSARFTRSGCYQPEP